MMTEKDMYLSNWDREHKTTLKVLKAYPVDKQDMKPAEKARSAKELAEIFVGEQSVIVEGVLNGKIEFGGHAATVPALPEIISALEKSYPAIASKVAAMSEEEWNSMMDFPVGPGQMGKLRKADILWIALQDQIHHRGQFSVYLRLAGAKVPSIYGPSADEPWM